MTQRDQVVIGDTPALRSTLTEPDSTGTSLVVDISTASVVEILLMDPDGNISTHTAGFVTDGTDGALEYECSTTDIDQKGEWAYRGRATMAGGQVYTANDWELFDAVK